MTDWRTSQFVGKTIATVDTRCCNCWNFTFTDGTQVSIWADSDHVEGVELPLLYMDPPADAGPAEEINGSESLVIGYTHE